MTFAWAHDSLIIDNVSAIKIVQITDTHIMPKGETWHDVNTHERLKTVVNHINNLEAQPNFIVITGDVTETGDIPSYEHAKEILDNLKAPYYVTCGNHDKPANLRSVFRADYAHPHHNCHLIENKEWQVFILDSHLDDSDGGHLPKEQLDWLQASLNPNKKVVLFMHHFPPVVPQKLFNKMCLFIMQMN